MSWPRHWVGWLALCLTTGGAWQFAWGEAPADASPNAPWRVRRLLVPEELIPSRFPNYRPIRRETFEAEVQRLNARALQAANGGAKLVRATYRARLDGSDQLSGDAALEVAKQNSGAELLQLSPCTVAVGTLRWDEKGQNAPVASGSNAAGEFLAIVDRAGTLAFPWSVRGSIEESGERLWRFSVPHCPATRLILDLPPDLVPKAEGGVIQSRLVSPAASPSTTPTVLWEIEFGGRNDLEVRVVPQAPQQGDSPILGRESIRYRLSTSGLELRATFQLTTSRPRIDRLRLEFSPGLHLASAHAGDRPLALATQPGPREDTSVEVILDEPLIGTDCELTVLAYAPLVKDSMWELPRVRPSDVIWQEGAATLEVPDPLSLATIQIREGVENRIEPLPAPENGELRQVQFWSPRGTVVVQLTDPPPLVVADVGTSIRFSEQAATARMVIDLRSRRGDTFEVRGTVAPGWTIDSVQSEPAEAMESFATQGTTGQILSVRLRHAVPEDEIWRLTVRAHRRAPRMDQLLRAEAVRLMELQQVQVERNLVSLGAEPPVRLVLTGDESLERLALEQLSGRAAELVMAPTGSILFAEQVGNRGWGVTLSRELPRFVAQVRQVVEVGPRQVAETLEFSCEPQQSFVSRLLVHFSRADGAGWEWKLFGAADERVSARLVSAAPETSGESWEVVLSRPHNAPFTVQAVRRHDRRDQMPLTFASLPEATSQTGFLQVHSLAGGPVEIHGQNMQAMAPPLSDTTRLPTLRGAYRFSPSQDVAATITSLPADGAPPSAWIWLLDTQSRCDPTGELTHETRLYLENTGAPTLSVQLPAEAKLVRVAVDHGVLGLPPVVAGQFTIPLPAERRFPLVTVTYRASTPPLNWAQNRVLAGLRCDLPCLRREATCWLPAGFSGSASHSAELLAGTADERLLGAPLWRRGGRPFDLFQQQDWVSLVDHWTAWWSGEPASRSVTNLTGRHEPEWREWTGVSPLVGEEESQGEWTPVRLAGVVSPEVWIFRRTLMAGWAWGVFLILFGLGAGLKRLPVTIVVGLVITFACAALLTPLAWSEPFRAAWQGLALGAAWRPWWRRQRLLVDEDDRRAAKGNHHSRSFVLGPAATSVWVLVAFLSGWANGQDTRSRENRNEAAAAQLAEPAAGPGITVNVLSPVDDQQKPKGDYLFVPQSLYDALYRPDTASPPGGLPYWLETAQHDVLLMSGEEGDHRLFAREYIADLTLRVFEAEATVSFPWVRERLRIVEALVDGQPVVTQWNAEGTAFSLRVEGSGSHRLRLVARPLPANPVANGEFRLTIPACPRSRMAVHAAGHLERLDIPLPVGGIQRDNAAGTLVAELGGASELAVRWLEPVVNPTAAVDTDVAELLWLYVQSNSQVLHGKFRISARNGTLGQVAFLVDRRLHLLPLAKDQPVAFVDVQPGSPLVRCWLDRPTDEVTLELSFAMSGTTSFGHWQLPQVIAQGTRRAPPWLGITVTEGLEAQILADNPPQKVVASEFIRAWGEEREPPQQAYVVGADAAAWQIAARPAPTKWTIEEQQDVLIGTGRTRFRYEAVMSADQGRLAQLRLTTPSKFTPDNVVVLHDDTDRLLRWSRAQDQEMSVFFTAPLAGHVRVLVEGTAPALRGPRAVVTPLAARDVPSRPRRVNVFREDALRVKVLESPGLAGDPKYLTRSDAGRFVGSFLELEGPSELTGSAVPSGVVLEVQPNQPQAIGSLVTEMNFRDGQWFATADLHLQLQSGSLDAIRIQIPEEWSGPVHLVPPMEQQLLTPPGERGRLLVARLPAAIDRELRLSLSGEISAAPGAPVRVPELRVLDVRSLQRYVVLPTRLQRQKALWETSGMQSAELPADHTLVAGSAERAVYRVVGSRSAAVLREVERATGTPQLALADYQLRWSAEDRRVTGVATFFLEPARMPTVDVRLPDGASPLHFRVAGMPARGRLVEPQRWRIPLGPELLPQLVEVLFEIEGAPNPWLGGDFRFSAPVLDGIPAEQSLWSVQNPQGVPSGTVWLSHTAIPADQARLLRFQTVAALRAKGFEEVSQVHPLERDAWRREWDRRLRQLEVAPAGNDAEPTKEPPEPATGTLALAPDLAIQWSSHTAPHEPGEMVCARIQGEASQFRVHYPRTGLKHWATVISQCSLLAIGAAVALMLVSWPRTRMIWRHAPHLVIAVGGFCWWLLMSPSVVGLAIMGLGVGSAWRSRWRLYH